MELIRDGPENARENRERRASVLNELCGNNCYPYPTDYVAGYRYPNKGYWMPRAVERVLTGRELLKLMREKIADERRLNRSTRRRLSKPANLKQFLSESGALSGGAEFWYEELPVAPDIIENRYIQRYLEGQITEHEMDAALQRWIRDPVYFFGLWYKFAGKKNHLEEMVEQPFIEFSHRLEIFFDLIEKRKRLLGMAKRAQREYARKYYRSDPRIRHTLPHPKSSGKEVKECKFKSVDFDEKFNGMNYLNCFLDTIFKRGASLEKSDFGDLMHFYHHNQVDLIRLDVRMARIFKGCPHIDTNKIVPRLRELVGRIETYRQ